MDYEKPLERLNRYNRRYRVAAISGLMDVLDKNIMDEDWDIDMDDDDDV